MDQGIAALIAGIAGTAGALGGAVAGAIGAVRGARAGAETTAEATRQQVRDQAAVEHSHWLRQQRQAAYSAFIAASQVAQRAAEAAMRDAPGLPGRDEIQALGEAIETLSHVSSQVSVLGPENMIAMSGQVFRGLFILRAALDAGDQAAYFTQDHQDRIDASWDEFVDAGRLFQESARSVLVGESQ